MKICVYGAASDRIDEKYTESGFLLGKTLAERGHSLVYGAGSEGLMGAVAKGFKAGGGFVHGVIPKFFEEGGYESIFYEADKITYTETMAERKTIMEDECDAFIITPGGIGTMEEFFQVLTLKQLARHEKAIAIFNDDLYYEELKKMLEFSIKEKFINDECYKLYKFLDTVEEVVDYIENYTFTGVDATTLKRNIRKSTR